jgi:hypothetical protein
VNHLLVHAPAAVLEDEPEALEVGGVGARAGGHGVERLEGDAAQTAADSGGGGFSRQHRG